MEEHTQSHFHINEWMWHNLGRARPGTRGVARTILVVTLVLAFVRGANEVVVTPREARHLLDGDGGR